MKILLALDVSPCSRKMLICVASNENWFPVEYACVRLHMVAPGAGRTVPPDAHARPVLDEAAGFLHGCGSLEPLMLGAVTHRVPAASPVPSLVGR